MVRPTMMKTIVEVSQVSFQLGHVTFETSRRTSPKNASGLRRARGGAGRSLPAPVVVFFVASAICFSINPLNFFGLPLRCLRPFFGLPLRCLRPFKLAGVEGLEPTAYGFGDRRSTN